MTSLPVYRSGSRQRGPATLSRVIGSHTVDLILVGNVGLAAAVAFLVPGLIDDLLAVVVGLALGVAMWRRPDRTLQALLLVMPLQVVILSLVLSAGVPASLVKAAGNWNELALVVLMGVAIRHGLRAGHRLDALDRLGLAYAALVVAYLVVPLLARPFMDLLPQAPDDPVVLLASLRTNIGFVLLFLAVRHLPLSDASLRRLTTTAVVVAAVVGGLTVIETVSPDAWQRFFRSTIGVADYSRRVLGSTGGLVGSTRVTGISGSAIRAGSVLFQAITLGFFLLPGMALALHRWLVRADLRTFLAVTATLAGVLLTFTRSAVLAAAVLVLSTTWLLPKTVASRRIRSAVTSVGAVVAGLWLASSVGLVERFTASIEGSDPSTVAHVARTSNGWDQLLAHPLGLGLATGPTASGRIASDARVLSENAYLQVGLEVGVIGMVLFLAFVLAVVVAAARRGRTIRDSILPGAIAAAGAGLVVGGMFLHVWTNFATAWTFWGLAGLALRVRDEST